MKIALYINGGILHAVRSDISPELEIEVVDCDNDPDTCEDRWDALQKELKYGNY